ncbi:MAG: helix-turn-helix transcriptional regulator, partial [Alphaproteobacteria bacterium]|nr:helix-turn-helix transcriptional regulator [Alphaproteobacteria bacterium]
MTSDLLRTFGKHVRDARVRLGWTLETLAETALANPDRKGYLSQIENGKRPISALTIGNLARVLDLPTSVTDPVMHAPDPDDAEPSTADKTAERLLTLAAKDETGRKTSEALLITLAYEFADGDHID